MESNSFSMPTVENMKRISTEYLSEHFDDAMELCHAENAICIERDGLPDCVLMTAEAYEAWTGEKIVIPDDYRKE